MASRTWTNCVVLCNLVNTRTHRDTHIQREDQRPGMGGEAQDWEGRRSARNHRRIIDAMWKMWETRVEGEENVDEKVLEMLFR